MTQKKETKRIYRKLTDIQHVLERPNQYLGSVDENEFQEYFLENEKYEYKTISYVPGLVKIINEFIDNSCDEAGRTNFEYGTKINVTFDDKNHSIIIEDNGRGIDVIKAEDGTWVPVMC